MNTLDVNKKTIAYFRKSDTLVADDLQNKYPLALVWNCLLVVIWQSQCRISDLQYDLYCEKLNMLRDIKTVKQCEKFQVNSELQKST